RRVRCGGPRLPGGGATGGERGEEQADRPGVRLPHGPPAPRRASAYGWILVPLAKRQLPQDPPSSRPRSRARSTRHNVAFVVGAELSEVDISRIVRLVAVRGDEQRPEDAVEGHQALVVAEEQAAGVGGDQMVEDRRDPPLVAKALTAGRRDREPG